MPLTMMLFRLITAKRLSLCKILKCMIFHLSIDSQMQNFSSKQGKHCSHAGSGDVWPKT